MVMNVEVLIIGAGVIGLAIARHLSERIHNVLLVEKHDGFGRETSSRNSEVIHAGIYYPDNSLKARLCVEGNRLMYSLCSSVGIAHRRCGKIVVATTDDEEEIITQLYEQGRRNGCRRLEILTSEQVRHMEPDVHCSCALWSPTTGILSVHDLMQYFERTANANGATITYNCEVLGIEHCKGGWKVSVRDVDGTITIIGAEVVINAAGLNAAHIASMAGIDVDAARYRIRPCKGEYFRVSNRHRGKLSHLVYPVPTHLSLGAHAVLGLDGSLRVGPNAFFVDSISYDVDPAHRDAFYAAARRFLPFLEADDLTPDQAGIRPKLQTEKENFRDFVIREESDRGLSGLVNLIGIESPGLTSALSIAAMVGTILRGARTKDVA